MMFSDSYSSSESCGSSERTDWSEVTMLSSRIKTSRLLIIAKKNPRTQVKKGIATDLAFRLWRLDFKEMCVCISGKLKALL